MKKEFKTTETLEQFLARGGKVNKVPAGVSTKNAAAAKPETVKSSKGGGPAVIVSMDEADLYHGETKARKAKKKITPTIDISALPEELRKKYIDTVLNDQEKDEDEDS